MQVKQTEVVGKPPSHDVIAGLQLNGTAAWIIK